ncbi:nitroreductase family protein [Facklamia hominis]|uniref:nitroreductase family protein n=1 Tax=Facklamia hominis TaxID=178214 RepID=UPI0038FC4B30
MNSTIHTLLNHRSIRFFKDQAIPMEDLATMLDSMNRTATSTGMQMASWIRVTDPKLKVELAQVAHQPYLAKVPELFIFIVDIYRNCQIAKAKGYQGSKFRSMDNFFQGLADAYLQAQSLTLAAEASGLGAVFFGSILNDPTRVIQLLKLPELTFPILGLGMGYPDDQPEKKPRIPVDMKLGENSYPYLANYDQTFQAYDEAMSHYYDTRNKNQRSDTFTNQVISKLAQGKKKRAQLMRVVQSQGFDVWLEDETEYGY